VVGLPARVVRDMLLGAEGSSAVIGVRPSTSGTSLAAALARRKPLSSSLTIAETDFGSVLRIPLVRQRLPALPQPLTDDKAVRVDHGVDSASSSADGGDVSDCSNGGGSIGEYGLGISFSPGTLAGSAPGERSPLTRFFVLRLVAGGPAEMCGLIQVLLQYTLSPYFSSHVSNVTSSHRGCLPHFCWYCSCRCAADALLFLAR
jgi:hypothetical protein